MEERLTFYDSAGHCVAALLAVPDGGTDRIAVLCHGFLSSKNSTTNRTVTRLLLERGIGTFCFDFFGQGESEGPFERITTALAVEQTQAAIDLVSGKGFRKIGLMGSSFGGLVSILTAARRTDLVCLALKCPVVDFAEELRLEFGESEMVRWKATDTIPNIMGGANRIPLRYAFYEDCLRHTSTKCAPWYVIPADNKPFARLAVSSLICQKLCSLDLAYPTVTEEQRRKLAEARWLLENE